MIHAVNKLNYSSRPVAPAIGTYIKHIQYTEWTLKTCCIRLYHPGDLTSYTIWQWWEIKKIRSKDIGNDQNQIYIYNSEHTMQKTKDIYTHQKVQCVNAEEKDQIN